MGVIRMRLASRSSFPSDRLSLCLLARLSLFVGQSSCASWHAVLCSCLCVCVRFSVSLTVQQSSPIPSFPIPLHRLVDKKTHVLPMPASTTLHCRPTQVRCSGLQAAKRDAIKTIFQTHKKRTSRSGSSAPCLESSTELWSSALPTGFFSALKRREDELPNVPP